jgi:hypothetical protein
MILTGAADPMITDLAGGRRDAAATPYSEKGSVGYPMAYRAPLLTLGGNCSHAGQRRHGDEDDAGPVRGSRCALRRTEVRRPPASWTFPPLQGISKDLGFETVSKRRHDYAPLLRFLILVTAASAEGRWFPLRSPVKGKSNVG